MTSFIKDRNNKIDFRNSKKLNLKSICITKIPEGVTFDQIKEVCATYGQIHTIHETVKNCSYSFINFEFLENDDEVLTALSEIGVECKRGQRKQENLSSSKKQHLLHSDDLKIFDEVARDFNQKKLDTLENWDDDDNVSAKVDHLNFESLALDSESVASSYTKTRKQQESANTFQPREEKQDLPEKKTVPTSPCVLCKEDASLVCSRCGDYYCTKECQRSDWPAHRYICFPIP